MYKSILLTDKELELLKSILDSYLSSKSTNKDQNIINAHILLRVISNKKSNEARNEIAFFGKSG
jgi:ribosomal protein S26